MESGHPTTAMAKDGRERNVTSAQNRLGLCKSVNKKGVEPILEGRHATWNQIPVVAPPERQNSKRSRMHLWFTARYPSPRCTICDTVVEDDYHVLLDCKTKTALWLRAFARN
ncbi:hypothetical protein BGW37DRAFT_519321 [Umbelopsis sp. PMI_123]|nr:hypothetical protein BGW37DRAFT_519321 [Umbelopsis sp. PMI_123]